MLDLSQTAILARLSIKMWSARKLDHKVTADTNKAHGAKSDAGRYNKALVAPAAMAKLTETAGAARRRHATLTLPWLDDGARILTTTGLDAYGEDMRRLREDFEGAVSSFLAGYPDFVADAQERLGDMFRREDYPSPGDVAKRFSFDVALLPVPIADDFRAGIDADLAAEIRADIEKRTMAAAQEAQRDAWRRVLEVAGHMAERLAAYKPAEGDKRAQGTFKDSLVGNVKDLAKVLPMLDLAGDGDLQRMAERLTAELAAIEPKTLRENDAARERTQEKAAAIVRDVQAFMA